MTLRYGKPQTYKPVHLLLPFIRSLFHFLHLLNFFNDFCCCLVLPRFYVSVREVLPRVQLVEQRHELRGESGQGTGQDRPHLQQEQGICEPGDSNAGHPATNMATVSQVRMSHTTL